MRKIALVTLVAIFAVLLVYAQAKKPSPSAPTPTPAHIWEAKGGIAGLERCQTKLEDWLRAHVPPEKLAPFERFTVEIVKKPYVKPAGDPNVFYCFVNHPSEAGVKTVTTCEKEGNTLHCYISLQGAEKLSKSERGALLSVAFADCIYEFLAPWQGREEWRWEMFKEFMHSDGGKYYSDCLEEQ